MFLGLMWKVYLVTCFSLHVPLPDSAPQTAHGSSSPRCSCCCRRSLTCSCRRGSSALPGARTSCWRARPPTAPRPGMRAKTCAGRGWPSPPAKQHTWVRTLPTLPATCVFVCICMTRGLTELCYTLTQK